MAIAKVFKNHVANCRVSHPDGTIISFNHGKCITTHKKDIEYLQSLVDAGDTYVYVDPDEAEVDTEELSVEGRIAKLKREAIEEYKATLANMPASLGDSAPVTGNTLGMGTSGTVLNSLESNSATTAPGSSAPAENASIGAGVKVSVPAAPVTK